MSGASLEMEVPAGSAGAELAGSPQPGASLDDVIMFRRATSEDINFIKMQWLKITRQVMPDKLGSDDFYREHEDMIGDLAEFCDCWIACDRNYSFYIYGFIVGFTNPDKSLDVHFIFTRDEWRKQGVARRLLAHMDHDIKQPLHVSHWSHWVQPKKFKQYKVRFNPYIILKVYRHARKVAARQGNAQ